MKTRRLLLSVVCGVMLVAGAYAQGPPPPGEDQAPGLGPHRGPGFGPGMGRRMGGFDPALPGEAGDAELRELMETTMAARLAAELDLNDEQTVLMVRRFSEMKKRVNAHREKRIELVQELRTSVETGEPDAKIEAKLNKLIEHDTKAAQVRNNLYEEACAGFSVSQRAKVYVFFNDFEAEMRRLIQRARAHHNQPFGRFDEGPPDQFPEEGGMPRGPGRGPGRYQRPGSEGPGGRFQPSGPAPGGPGYRPMQQPPPSENVGTP